MLKKQFYPYFELHTQRCIAMHWVCITLVNSLKSFQLLPIVLVIAGLVNVITVRRFKSEHSSNRRIKIIWWFKNADIKFTKLQTERQRQLYIFPSWTNNFWSIIFVWYHNINAREANCSHYNHCQLKKIWFHPLLPSLITFPGVYKRAWACAVIISEVNMTDKVKSSTHTHEDEKLASLVRVL